MPVVGKTAAEIAARAATFRRLAQIQLEHPDFAALNISFRPETANILAECYFALSEAYKIERLPPGSRTNWIKAAALVAATVCAVNPLRPAGRSDSLEWLYINPQFALLCAYGHARSVFLPDRFDEKRRFYQSFQNVVLPSLAPIIAEGNASNGVFKSTWKITLSDSEKSYLDLLVSSFVLLDESGRV